MENHPISKKSVYVIATLFAMALQSSSALAEELPEIRQEGNITYITGGIGDEEFNAMKAVQHNYNLRVLSAGTNGAYSGDTHIIISDSHGNELLSTDADPLFYAKLQPGHYVVQESSEGQSRKQPIVIAANKPVKPPIIGPV